MIKNQPLRIKEGIKRYNEKHADKDPDGKMTQVRLKDLVLRDEPNIPNRVYHMNKWCNSGTLDSMTPFRMYLLCKYLKVDANYLLGMKSKYD